GIPVFEFPEDAAMTLAGLVRQVERGNKPRGRRRRFKIDPAPAQRELSRAKTNDKGWVDPAALGRVLRHYGIPMATTEHAKTPRSAARLAAKVGFPVCLKADAPDLLHKSDLGGVRIGLTDETSVLGAAQDIESRLRPEFADLGFEIQSMAPGHRELLMGFRRDPAFGPVFAVGFGGVTVEVLRDVAVRVGPLLDGDPQDMLSGLRGTPLLDAFRGQPSIDKKLVCSCLLRLAQLAEDLPELAELEINPFIADRVGGHSMGVDCRGQMTRT
ncbi:MAG: acetate--CoA ligase family protein, partial [Salinibacterium sp.]|nr:acetate--CoA ligase family protein [Salinibacterium sp.]